MKFVWALMLSFLLISTSCTSPSSKVANQVVIDVNGETMTAKEFADRLARQLKKFDALTAKDPGNVQRAKEEILRVFVMNCLSMAYAKANQISVADEELEKEINLIRASFPDDLSFRRVLAEEGLSLTDWKEDLRKTLIERKVFRRVAEKIQPPSNDEIKKYYEENKEHYKRKERVYLRQIITDDLGKAQSIKDEMKKKNFAELAKKYSVSPEAKAGGLIGWMERGSVDIFDKAFALPVGGVSQVLESSYGFHIFKVERKAPAGWATIEEVRPQIVQALMGRKEQGEFAGWLDKQIRGSRVLRNNELLRAITVETKN
jgi:peptidyl-prolyl cis-trans isomerase C